jgi:hypothetical protein
MFIHEPLWLKGSFLDQVTSVNFMRRLSILWRSEMGPGRYKSVQNSEVNITPHK